MGADSAPRPDWDIGILIGCSKAKRVQGNGKAVGSEVPARELYLGRQHRAMVRSVDAFRTARPDLRTGLFIVSAEHGILAEYDSVAPYDTTLGSTRGEWQSSGERLGLPRLAKCLAPRARGWIVALSKSYLIASSLPSPALQHAVYLVGAEVAEQSLGFACILAGRKEARLFRTSEREIRAVVLELLLEQVAREPAGALEAIQRSGWQPQPRTLQPRLAMQ